MSLYETIYYDEVSEVWTKDVWKPGKPSMVAHGCYTSTREAVAEDRCEFKAGLG